MDNEPLVRAVIAALMLLEHSGDEEINPDVAVRGMENIGHELETMTDADRADFRRILDEIAGGSEDVNYANFVRAIPLMLWGPQE